jgi:hypothetical protein
MQIFYLANVGTRDVARRACARPSPRKDGEQWLRDFDAIHEELDAPILRPGLEHVLETAPSSTVQVVLFFTDQDAAKVDERYRQADTLHFAAILQKLLPQRLEGRVRVQSVRIEGSPADYNNTLAFFKKALPEQVEVRADDVVYIAPVGGADASNVGLAINAVRRYRDRCQFIYVLENAGVQLLNLHAELLGDYARREAEAHLDRRDYAALRQTLRQARLGEPWHLQLCTYADCRTRFAFGAARTVIEQALAEPQSGEARARLGQLMEEIKPFLNEVTPPRSSSSDDQWQAWFDLQRKLLVELYFNLKRKVLQEEWVDFLSRLFRLQEAVLRLVFEMETKHSTYKHKEIEFKDFHEAIRAATDLAASLEKNDVHIEEPNSRNLGQVLRYWVEIGGKGRQYGKVNSVMKVIGDANLADLRNQSIAAHGYQGVTKTDVEQKAKRSIADLLEQVKEAVAALGGTMPNDPYDAIDQQLRAAL